MLLYSENLHKSWQSFFFWRQVDVPFRVFHSDTVESSETFYQRKLEEHKENFNQALVSFNTILTLRCECSFLILLLPFMNHMSDMYEHKPTLIRILSQSVTSHHHTNLYLYFHFFCFDKKWRILTQRDEMFRGVFRIMNDKTCCIALGLMKWQYFCCTYGCPTVL